MVLAGRPGRVTASRRGRPVTAVQSSSGRCHRHTRHTRHTYHIYTHICTYLRISTHIYTATAWCWLWSSEQQLAAVQWPQQQQQQQPRRPGQCGGASGWVAAEQRTADDCGKGHSNPHKHVQKQVRRRALGWAGAREVSIYTI